MQIDEKALEAAVEASRFGTDVRKIILAYESAKQKGEAEGWRSDLDAMPHGGDFLAENRFGDWVIARRFDPLKSGDYSGNAVINKRAGRWWHPQRWRPLPSPPTAAAGRR